MPATKQQSIINESNFAFLKLVAKNNSRDWFNRHKEKYLQELVQMENFAEALLFELNKKDVIETPNGKKSLHRIYRDTRFSKIKTPYKTNWSGSYKRATKKRRGGYYFHIESGNNFVAGGFWGPNPEDLKRIRDDIAFDDKPLRKILDGKDFKQTFGKLTGEQIKTRPKGFDANHPAIDLLRYKQFILIKRFSNEEVLQKDFVKKAAQTFYAMRPFLDYMSEVLTTDLNGLSNV
jgi:uncharacterized protein (TIGR02453 family)